VVPTRNRPAQVRECLTRLLALDYPSLEVVIVDNAPSSDATMEVVRSFDDRRVRYILDPRAGVSNARNRGIAAARGEIVAFVDDDVITERLWLRGLVGGFSAGPDVGGVCGLVLPQRLDVAAERWFDQFGRFAKGFERRLFDRDGNRPTNKLFPYAVGTIGTGANAAFRVELLRRLGGFDIALGPGTPAAGGEDLDLLFRVIDTGTQVAFEPSACVFHSHPSEYEIVRSRAFTYGLGLGAYLTKCVVTKPGRLGGFLLRLPSGLQYLLHPRSAKNLPRAGDFPKELGWLELYGFLHGPVAYLRSRLALRGAAARTCLDANVSQQDRLPQDHSSSG